MVKDGKGKLLRGLSRNNCCILTAVGEETVMAFCGVGKPSKARVLDGLGRYMEKGATMIDDGEKSHSVLEKTYGLTREIHYTRDTKGLPDSINPMDRINHAHAVFKRFMKAHGGFLREDLQDWCNLFCFIYNHKGNLSGMVKDFLQMAVSTHEVIRYRDSMGKKPIKG